MGSAIVPEVAFTDIEANGGQFPEAEARIIRRRGCVVVRNMLPKTEAEQMLTDLTTYLSANNVNLKGSALKDVYWSKSQVQHRRIIMTWRIAPISYNYFSQEAL